MTQLPIAGSTTAKLWNTGVRTGGKVVIYMDGFPIAFAQSARFRDDYGLEPVNVIGQLQTIEYVPMHARHEITISVLVLRNVSLSKLGLEPTGAGSFGLLKAGGGRDALGDGFMQMDPGAAMYNQQAQPYGTSASTAADNFDLLPSDTNAERKAINGPLASKDLSQVWRVIHSKVFDIEVKDAQLYTGNEANQNADGKSVDAVAATGNTPAVNRWPRTIVKYKDCFFAGGDLNIDANRVLMHNVTFYARDKDASESALYSRA
jgi:hypothetical protein